MEKVSQFVRLMASGKSFSRRKSQNDNPADEYNTVLKMAKKRAHIDAMLTATAASDIFTQDLDEKGLDGEAEEGKAEPESEPESGQNEPPAARKDEKQPGQLFESLCSQVKAAGDLETLKSTWDEIQADRKLITPDERASLDALKEIRKNQLSKQESKPNPSGMTEEQRQENLIIRAIIKGVQTVEKLPTIAERISRSYADKKVTKDQAQELSDLLEKRQGELSK